MYELIVAALYKLRMTGMLVLTAKDRRKFCTVRECTHARGERVEERFRHQVFIYPFNSVLMHSLAHLLIHHALPHAHAHSLAHPSIRSLTHSFSHSHTQTRTPPHPTPSPPPPTHTNSLFQAVQATCASRFYKRQRRGRTVSVGAQSAPHHSQLRPS